ncbi:hypothetical protein MPTK1_1g20330 [Marchantia polymorpha subsp. ruderalis]|uniref:Uncharacterized protein n=2 Tax=Marchantia polymorpha TaxID=3197 RepID=A0AAF6AS86_MARPO|nr:hypothetical protein MARPO_0001s0370 [Marchantia polymorpha]BBM99303.1 hypothetical protein Mp_1g20330 [Marchantia polymorpha subsp. ruderalis]PTQ50386.1 hypothetical protein MARPO_0001s0370 [Marchantia polymorpha]PTQ50387.1 hypothetical protein MARPO_0001s0370 [Marchantia polymorpha]PTQ50388.1 hypothetical protein MARPO_0001s0370 [Marchantia polymorpha]|eukprot:PTQ50385.1 hypothetical protein MARPO_0001s0370 [Marchantia polymorpha]
MLCSARCIHLFYAPVTFFKLGVRPTRKNNNTPASDAMTPAGISADTWMGADLLYGAENPGIRILLLLSNYL